MPVMEVHVRMDWTRPRLRCHIASTVRWRAGTVTRCKGPEMFDLKPFEPATLVAFAALNPAVMIVGFWLGLKADQWQKLIVAGLAASMAGFLLLYAAIMVGAVHAKAIGGEAGIFALQVVFGMFWSVAGYGLAKAMRPQRGGSDGGGRG